MRSLSEIETAVKRASKAVGFSWGNSEEVGKSIRQLELFGLQGIKNLNQYYKERNTKKFEDLNLIYESNEASLEAYCPIILGISFLDQIKSVENYKTIIFKKIAYPVLFLSFLSISSEIISIVVEKAFSALKVPPCKITFPDFPTPTSWALSDHYYPRAIHIINQAQELFGLPQKNEEESGRARYVGAR